MAGAGNTAVTNWQFAFPYEAASSPEEMATNLRSVADWANQTPFLMFFAAGGSPLVGATPVAPRGAGGITTTPFFLIQGGNNTINFSALGEGILTYPRPFPNAVIAFTAMSGSNSTYANIEASPNPPTLKDIHLILTQTTPGAANAAGTGNTGITWMALGW